MVRGRAGLVVAGAGARGAYEAGALSVLLPWMSRTGPAPTVLVGTSAGALNVVGLGGMAHLPPFQAAEQLVETWSAVQLRDVFGLASGLETGLGYLGQLAGLPVRLPSLLDTERLRSRLTEWLPLESLHENIDAGRVDAVAVATTSTVTGGTVVFVEKNDAVALPPNDVGRNITYVETRLTVEHVMASAAVPLLFRPVRVTEPARWAGWYVDGGLRLNTPLKPALSLGCTRLGVVATQPMTSTTSPPPRAHRRTRGEPPGDAIEPDVYAVAALSLRVLMADRMIEDLHRLEEWNAGLEPGAASRAVEVIFAGPAAGERGDISALADAEFHRRYGGLGGLRSPSMWILERLIGGDPDDHGNLLSYLFFDSGFTDAVAKLGGRHARERLGEGDRDG
ncbi:patatin-like phospholipase family protein [Speluncibacter jeojiensis]|uniref:Patatin-like phospholipase family protein n=1 Tax=Speluncibacter jeojiensis TaxID=2710754 RepID=A0A9X4RFC0_9ACTN|nr:patatin-like phospholipase family protein [Rhodococcus sp. D2-41]MDG3016865.1 patatin-like phospholipase family protein [Corynebacteriales bacterium D3-21]